MTSASRNFQREIHWDLWFWRGILLLFLFRVLFLVFFPYDLAGDEAYYWDWGRHPDWGYFSKPPVIGWLMAFAGWAGRNSVFGIRVFAVLLGTGTLIFLFLLGRRMYGSRAAFWGVAAMAASPGNAALNLLLTIDAPLLFFWSASLYLFWRLLTAEKRRAAWGIALIFSLGLGALSKQMTLAFFACGLFFLIASPQYRFLLKKSWIWLGSLAALFFLIPPLYWNARNNWITFHHTAHHFQSSSPGLSAFLTHPAAFIGTQLFLISPVTWVLLMALSSVILFSLFKVETKERFLFIFGGLPLVIVLLMTLRQKINGNWPAAFYPSGILLLAAWATHNTKIKTRIDRWKKAFMPGIVVGALLAVFAYGLPLVVKATDLQGSGIDPLIRLEGWSGLAEKVAAIQTTFPRPRKTFVMTIGHRYLTSELAFYLPRKPQVYRWVESGKIQSQYELWGGPKGKKGWDCLIIIKGKASRVPPRLAERFQEIRRLKTITRDLGPGKSREYTLFRGIGWKEKMP
ncbi:MAG: glycosyltransferase family 39 protein [Deltaproteobacteria bacterium]|nr:glycosyltransferase family 39 protein [Deltaproteobacteria bacterium]